MIYDIYIYIYNSWMNLGVVAEVAGGVGDVAPEGELVLEGHLHPVSITRFPLRRFSPGAGLLRNTFVYR